MTSVFPHIQTDGFPQDLAVSSPAPFPAVFVATPPAVGAVRGQGAFHSAAAFVDTWIAAPRRIAPQPRPDYGPKYNGVGECPF